MVQIYLNPAPGNQGTNALCVKERTQHHWTQHQHTLPALWEHLDADMLISPTAFTPHSLPQVKCYKWTFDGSLGATVSLLPQRVLPSLLQPSTHVHQLSLAPCHSDNVCSETSQ